jgi:cytochrome b subunit of formate dehydrogenase
VSDATLERVEALQEAHVVVRRFSMWTRATHATLAASVFGLVLTGMPMRYPEAFWSKPILAMCDIAGGAAFLHRMYACGFFAAGAMHVAGLIGAFATRKIKLREIFGPDSIVPKLEDVKNVSKNMRYMQGKGPQPNFARFTYWEKFDYLAEIWGLLVIGLSGLVMWFPVSASRFLPGWVVNAALIFHAYEALLAMGFLFAIHFFNTHLRSEVFPVDPVIFSGNIPMEEIEHRYPGWYERLKARGAGFVPSRRDPSRSAVLISTGYLVVGFVTLMFVMLDALAETWRYLSAFLTE